MRTPAAPQSGTLHAAPATPRRDPFELRALPHEDLHLYHKKIDNSRLVREPDPRARHACWSAIGAACAVLALVAGVLAPSVATTLAGYKLEALRAEERRLLDERRALELQEAELLSPSRLEKLAKKQNLVVPSSGQVVRLDGNADAVAMVNGGFQQSAKEALSAQRSASSSGRNQ
jgi:cell division protein FtsL